MNAKQRWEYMRDKQRMIDMYKGYGFDMPLKAKYKRDPNRIYFIGDFKDGEIIKFSWCCEKPSACAIGNVFYESEHEPSQLVNIRDLEPIIE